MKDRSAKHVLPVRFNYFAVRLGSNAVELTPGFDSAQPTAVLGSQIGKPTALAMAVDSLGALTDPASMPE